MIISKMLNTHNNIIYFSIDFKKMILNLNLQSVHLVHNNYPFSFKSFRSIIKLIHCYYFSKSNLCFTVTIYFIK
jgi:hypothetical protein